MNGVLWRAGWLTLIGAFACADAVLGGIWYLDVVSFAVLAGTVLATKNRHDEGFYAFAAGETLVVTAAMSHPALAAAIQLALSALVLRSAGLLKLREERVKFLFFGILVSATMLFTLASRHAVLPLVILALLAGIAAICITSSEYRLKHHYGGNE
jgi:hypothetical protein